MEPLFRVSSERLDKPGIEHTTPGLDGKQLNHYATKTETSEFLCDWNKNTIIRSLNLCTPSVKYAKNQPLGFIGEVV